MSLKDLRASTNRWWNKQENENPVQETPIRYTNKIRSIRRECEEALFSFNPEMFKDFDVRRGFHTYVNVYFASISLYAKKLRQVQNLVAKEAAVANDWTPERTQQVLVDDFFLAENGHIQNFYDSAVDLRSSGLSLCKAMEASDEAEFGAHEHNLRMLSKVLSNLRDLILVFKTI